VGVGGWGWGVGGGGGGGWGGGSLPVMRSSVPVMAPCLWCRPLSTISKP
jgi:hypothetical protein